MAEITNNINQRERRVKSSSLDRGLASSQSGGVASPAFYKNRTGETTRIGNTISNSIGNESNQDIKVIQRVLRTYRKPKLNETISSIRFERYRDYYNSLQVNEEGKPKLREHLRSSHILVFKTLIRMVVREARNHLEKYSRDYAFEIGEYFEIRTNRPHLTSITGLSGASVKRQLKRLEDSGVIKTQFHGRNSNFSVHIDTQFLSFHESNTDTRNQIVTAPKEATCTPYSLVQHKKLIIDVDNSSSKIELEQSPEQHENTQEQLKGKSSGFNQTRTSTSTAQEHTGTKQEPLQGQGMKCDGLTQSKGIPRENSSATGISPENSPISHRPRFEINAPLDKVQDYALSVVHTIFALMMEKLYAGRDIAPVEQIRAQKTIYMQVFRHALNTQRVDGLEIQWRWRIQKIADYMTSRRYSHKGPWTPPTPNYYLDQENIDKGYPNFEWSAPKWDEHIKKEKNKRLHKAIVRKKRDDEYILKQALTSVAMRKNRDIIVYQKDFIRKNYPQLLRRFEMTLSDPQFISILRQEYDLKQAKVSIKRLITNS